MPVSRDAETTRPHVSIPTESRITAEERTARFGHKGGVIWLTGLSGAGKTTLATAVERRLFALGNAVYVLDGDEIRRGLSSDLGFSAEDRHENIRRVGEAAALFANAGMICLTALISPFAQDRARARAAAGRALFFEVYLSADMAVCERRDPKGLYREARLGHLRDFTGVDSPYEVPEAPALTLNTADLDVSTCADSLTAFVMAHCRG